MSRPHHDAASPARGGAARSAANSAPAPAPEPQPINELLRVDRLEYFLADTDTRPPVGLLEPRSVAQAEARMAAILAELQRKLEG